MTAPCPSHKNVNINFNILLTPTPAAKANAEGSTTALPGLRPGELKCYSLLTKDIVSFEQLNPNLISCINHEN